MVSLTSRLVGGISRSTRATDPTAEQPSREGLDGELAMRLVRSVESQGNAWFWESDRQGRLTYVSDKVADQIGPVGQSPIGRSIIELFEVIHDDGSERTLNFHLNARTSFASFEVRSAGRESDRIWTITGRPQLDEFDQFRGFVGYGADLTAERRSDAEIKRLALSDSLTGLANRARMRVSLDQLVAQVERGTRRAALFMLDLDRFKAVNDTLGHQVGDVLLKQVAQRLERAIGNDGLVGRLGGDEFQVIMPEYANREQIEGLAKSIIGSISQPYFISGANISIGCSIGIALAPEDGQDSETLIRNADLALYSAKAAGRMQHCFFRRELLTQAQSRKVLEDDLRVALERNQLWLAYQPVVSTASGQIVGYEALLRWNHPVRGPISPAEFIPIAEDSGLIDPIGEWVLRTACETASKWPRPARVAVNVSPIQFVRQALPAIVTSALANTGLDPARLELEITESVFLNESSATERMLQSLKELGVRLALDDFGTGYSSLAYLKKAPFDKIKIDQSFVKGASLDPRNVAIIKAVVAIAETLGLETTAEGVETQDGIDLIRGLGCSHIQGWVYGKAVPADEVAIQLEGAPEISAVGLKVNRPTRTTLLRSTRLLIGDHAAPARIRNISSNGLMIDGFAAALAAGQSLKVELGEGRLVTASVRWSTQGKAGLELAEAIDPSQLNPRGARPGAKL